MNIPSFTPSWLGAGQIYGGSGAVRSSNDIRRAWHESLSIPLAFPGYTYGSSPSPGVPSSGAAVPEDSLVPGGASSGAALPESGPLFSDTQDILAGSPDLSDIGDSFSGLLASTGDLQKDAADFNAKQAFLNREWQEYMSNTSYQRAVQDLKRAGLNPILAAGAHSGASTPTGSAATVNAVAGDTIGTLLAAIGSLASSIADFLPNVNFSKLVR